ncbi:MAG TPA: hypothetical protein VH370_15795 [Humisphaera sp.]|nr:hypothetical protein [Humisphaera sp.]
MAKAKKTKKDMAHWKPGSQTDAAKDVASKGDFGVPAGSGSERDREYVSNNTRMSDPGKTQPMAWEQDGVRDHGAGAPAAGPGSSSGGDLDPDIIGVGTGGSGIAAAGPDDNIGAADANATAPSGKTKTKQKAPPRRNARNPARSSTVTEPDITAGADAQGADAATNPLARGDDSFAGEISRGEARGEDLPTPPVGSNESENDGTEYRDDES